MYSRPTGPLADSPLAREARDLIRSCVHCGFCLPACPTYRVTGNELDSPRGRIYLIKELLEQGATNQTARSHLDRCLTCRACEPACPSGVQYGRLVDLGRELLERDPPAPRPPRQRVLRLALLAVAPRRSLFTPLVRAAQWLRPLLPHRMRSLVPARALQGSWPPARHVERMAVLSGCVQPALTPQVNAAAARVLDRLGVSLIPAGAIGCCGALDHHLGRGAEALDKVLLNVAAASRLLDDGVTAIVSTASGCGVFAKDYDHLARHEAAPVRQSARRVADATRDLCEVVDPVALRRCAPPRAKPLRVAWASPCSLQHGQRAATTGKVEALLRAVGCELVPIANPTQCCGSAGTYSLLQPAMSRELRARKLDSLLGSGADVIATANVGCQDHLRKASPVPVRHWIEIVDEALVADR
jgi:glycolate oxidase iron-sulfur subunit